MILPSDIAPERCQKYNNNQSDKAHNPMVSTTDSDDGEKEHERHCDRDDGGRARTRPPPAQLKDPGENVEDTVVAAPSIVTPARASARSNERSSNIPASASRRRDNEESKSTPIAQLKDVGENVEHTVDAAPSIVMPACPTAPSNNRSNKIPASSPPRQRARFRTPSPTHGPARTRLPLSGQASSGPWRIVWDIPVDAREDHLKVLVNAARNNELWSEEFIPVQEETIEIQHQDIPDIDEDEVVPVLAGLTDQSRTKLNPRTVLIYGAGLQSMNVDSITPIQDILKQQGNGEFTIQQTKFHLTFVAMPSVGKKPSIKNSAGIPFTSAALWHNTIQYRYVNFFLQSKFLFSQSTHKLNRHMPNGNKMAFMELCVKTPQSLLQPGAVQEHFNTFHSAVERYVSFCHYHHLKNYSLFLK